LIRQTITKPLFGAFTNLFSPADTAANVVNNAKGNAFANNKIVPYRKGGVVNSPTMFKYGGANLGIMGEAGPEAILPLQRGRGGKLGVAMQGGRGGSTTVNYTGPTLNFNGDEYVPKSAVGEIVHAAAARGESNTIQSLRHSRSRRANLGL
jgi:phage-related minor tail protein